MALKEVRLSPVQDDFTHVVVLADDGPVRVIVKIRREAIDDLLRSNSLTHQQRVEWVERNLSKVGDLIRQKYASGQYKTFTKGPATAPDTNAVMVIGGL